MLESRVVCFLGHKNLTKINMHNKTKKNWSLYWGAWRSSSNICRFLCHFAAEVLRNPAMLPGPRKARAKTLPGTTGFFTQTDQVSQICRQNCEQLGLSICKVPFLETGDRHTIQSAQGKKVQWCDDKSWGGSDTRFRFLLKCHETKKYSMNHHVRHQLPIKQNVYNKTWR